MGLLKSKGRVETAKDKVRPLAGSAVGTAREKVSPYTEKAVERGAAVAHAAVEKAGPVIDDALSKVGPATEHAAEKARERFNDDVLPKVTAALATLAAAAEPLAEETSRRGRATAAALKGEIEVPAKKSHKLRKVVLFLGFGALAAAAVKKLLTPPEPAWQSTPTSGRDYSSAPAGTTSRPAADKPGTAAPKAESKPDTTSVNGKTEDTNGKTEDVKADAKADEAAPKASSNGTAKKTAGQRRSSEGKPTDS